MTATLQAPDLLNENFETPAHHADILQVVNAAAGYYQEMPHNRHDRKMYRQKLNEVIDEYNERRGMRIYAHIH